MTSGVARRTRAVRRVAVSRRENWICEQARQKEAVRAVAERRSRVRAAGVSALHRVKVASVRDRQYLAKDIRAHLDSRQETLADLISCDYLTLLGDLRKERIHTAILAFLLNPKVVGETARALLVEMLRHATGKHHGSRHGGYARMDAMREWLETGGGQIRCVRRETALVRRGAGKPDIVVVLADGRRVLIENKVGALEHDNQTKLYYREAGHRAHAEDVFIFLDQKDGAPQCRHFVPMNYSQLGDALKAVLQESRRGRVAHIIEDYCESLAALSADDGAIGVADLQRDSDVDWGQHDPLESLSLCRLVRLHRKAQTGKRKGTQ